jgi:uncharacterized protein YndB with AHSA1/START domain
MEKASFVYVTYIETTPEQLWKALTTDDFTKSYWFGRRVESSWKIGAPVRFYYDEGKGLDVEGKVEQYDPFTRLAYSWNSWCDEESKAAGQSHVAFELEQQGKHVKLRLIHDGFEKEVPQGIQNGWPFIMNSLKSLLEHGKPLVYPDKIVSDSGEVLYQPAQTDTSDQSSNSSKTKCPPDISARPHSLTVEHFMNAEAAALYEAWTERFDLWFAEPGALLITPEVDRPYFFYNRRDWGSHPHYGRFVELDKDKLVEMTWVTGPGGTEGAETVLRIELVPHKHGTNLRLTHSGFADEKSCEGHKQAWKEGLVILDELLKEKLAVGIG